MLELALAWTDLFRLWQDGRTLAAYQREHHSRLEVLEALGCMPGLGPVALKIVCDEKGLDVNTIQDEKKLAELKDEAVRWFRAALGPPLRRPGQQVARRAQVGRAQFLRLRRGYHVEVVR